jgi:hypothetical protein
MGTPLNSYYVDANNRLDSPGVQRRKLYGGAYLCEYLVVISSHVFFNEVFLSHVQLVVDLGLKYCWYMSA